MGGPVVIIINTSREGGKKVADLVLPSCSFMLRSHLSPLSSPCSSREEGGPAQDWALSPPRLALLTTDSAIPRKFQAARGDGWDLRRCPLFPLPRMGSSSMDHGTILYHGPHGWAMGSADRGLQHQYSTSYRPRVGKYSNSTVAVQHNTTLPLSLYRLCWLVLSIRIVPLRPS